MKFLLTLILVCICYGCAHYTDMSKEVQFSHLIKHCLKLKEDVFFVQYSDTKKYALKLPGTFSSLPPTILAYYENPNGWNWPENVMGVVPKGTKLTIYKIVEKNTLESNFISFYAKIDDSRYPYLGVDISFLLDENFSEKTYFFNERYLEYCEE